MADLGELTAEINELAATVERWERLYGYTPSTKQREFHAMGADHPERVLFAGNRCGKTFSGSREMAFHLLGGDAYPDWWVGRRFEKPIMGWAGGVSAELTRDVMQKYLLGDPTRIPDSLGEGMIPRERILQHRMARGISNSIDTVTIRHSTGGTSTLKFKAYDQRHARWQAQAVNVCWLDEEPPLDIYMEALTRTNDGGQAPGQVGITYLTFTPLKGISDVVNLFYPDPGEGRGITFMSIDDVNHFDEEQKRQIINRYAPHERRARMMGLPALGSGLVYPVAESQYVVEPFRIPDHWPQIIGLDFGWDHPFAAAKCAFDRDNGIMYLVAEYAASEQPPAIHAEALRGLGGDSFPLSWPHDAAKHDTTSGEQLAYGYYKMGLKMLPEHATHETGGFGREAGIQEILEAKLDGRIKVFSSCGQYLKEIRSYHRVDGKIHDKNDDVLDAFRKAWMMRRYARTLPNVTQKSVALTYETQDNPLGLN